MHHHYFMAILPVTGLVVFGYLTLSAALSSQGKMRTAGQILAAWVFLLAVAVAAHAVQRFMGGDDGHHGYRHHGSMKSGEKMELPAGPPPPPEVPAADAPLPAPPQ